MSILDYMEKVARMDSMPRNILSESSIPYKERKERYKKFINRRAKKKMPGNNDYVVEGAVPMGIVGGVTGGLFGAAEFGGRGAAVGAIGGGLLGAGVGALIGRAAAANEQEAIRNAKKVVKGGQYDKALQDEIIAYRRHKEMERQNERDWDRFENRLHHRQTQSQLNRIERNQLRRY